jgi:hypothetical protein
LSESEWGSTGMTPAATAGQLSSSPPTATGYGTCFAVARVGVVAPAGCGGSISFDSSRFSSDTFVHATTFVHGSNIGSTGPGLLFCYSSLMRVELRSCSVWSPFVLMQLLYLCFFPLF